jgi:hypothetical protein
LGEMLDEDDADHLGAPVGMVTAKGLCLKENKIGGVGNRSGSRTMVGRSGDGAVVEVALAEQVLDGTEAQVEPQG